MNKRREEKGDNEDQKDHERREEKKTDGEEKGE